jgi:pimeloyl-ACP methyl ester carboxylesterase
VLLHGSHLNTHECFAALAAQLDGTFQVIAPDVRGFGRSVSPEPQSHTWEQYVADVLALLDHLRLPTATIGGQSFGAGIAVATALRAPARVGALVIAQPAYAGAKVGHTESQKHVWVQGRALVKESAADGLLAAMLRSQADDAGRAWVLGAVAQQQDESSFLAAHRGEMQTAQPFSDVEDLQSIDVPVLLIPGDDPGTTRSSPRCTRGTRAT